MSRAAFSIALGHLLGHPPTDAELSSFIAQLREVAGERVYVPQREPTDPAVVAQIHGWRDAGWSVRRIAKESGCSKSQVHRVLSQNPALLVDSRAA